LHDEPHDAEIDTVANYASLIRSWLPWRFTAATSTSCLCWLARQAPPSVDPVITPKVRSAFLAGLCLIVPFVSLAAIGTRAHAQQSAQRDDSEEGEHWLAVAPGWIEPASGVIAIVGPVMGVVGEVLVKANETVFAGEPLIRLTDNETQGRLAAADISA
jgi:multidrug efflux pump subunit AcrA (membrane-fusion protein)